MKRLLIGLLLVSLAICLPCAYGALITQLEPNIPDGSNYVFLNIDLTNNDEGAIYDSGELTLLAGLAQQLWDVIPANQSTYSNIEELVGDWAVGIMSWGQVYAGWNEPVVNPDASIQLNHAPFGYHQWFDEITNPDQNTMALTIQIPLSQLELDGIAGYDPSTDARIELGTTPVNNAFVGDAGDGLNSWQADGVSYEVIPEPSSVLLSVFGLLLFVCYHRLLRKSACGCRGL